MLYRYLKVGGAVLHVIIRKWVGLVTKCVLNVIIRKWVGLVTMCVECNHQKVGGASNSVGCTDDIPRWVGLVTKYGLYR